MKRKTRDSLLFVFLTIGCLFVIARVSAETFGDTWDSIHPLWVDETLSKPDTYAAFRGSFELTEPAEIEIRCLASSWFNAWVDGEFVGEGPARFHRDFPEYDTIRLSLSAGRHVVTAQVHFLGLDTRILDNLPPFWACEIFQEGKSLSIDWRCLALSAYESQIRRINPQLGWIEWCDTNALPVDWQSIAFDDSGWAPPVLVNPSIGPAKTLSIASVPFFTHSLKSIAEGPLAETFGYERDDIPARFFLRDLFCEELPAQGIWRRYDLDRVRLARPRFLLDLPPGAIVEFAYSEALSQDRVSPYITLSAGSSCNLDHYVARGGRQEFFPLTPRGGRFMEIHIFANPDKIHFLKEESIERCYYGPPAGSFQCGDDLIERIWMTGIETLRGCCEDAVIDNPTRERGEWTGDVSTVAMDIASVGYSDLRLCRRALVHSALCAREDGMVAGLCPGGEAYIPSYSAQWVTGCLRYFELTGDRSLLDELFRYAERNLAAFERVLSEEGLLDGLGWIFIDWGYVRNPGPSDMALNLHYLAALRDMIRWCEVVGKTDRIAHYTNLEQTLQNILHIWYDDALHQGAEGWNRIGYHRAVLGLRLNFFSGQTELACVNFIQRHILHCFPNEESAPRNSDPSVNNPRLITPYFAHYTFPLLIERGQMDFVLGQYRRCWGWALQGDRTTWLEVFDTRWSHCHQWAGCPTGQLSRYVLGLHPRYDLGNHHFIFQFQPGSLQQAKGVIPLPGDQEQRGIEIQWKRRADGIHYDLSTPLPIVLHLPTDSNEGLDPNLSVQSSCHFIIDEQGTIRLDSSFSR